MNYISGTMRILMPYLNKKVWTVFRKETIRTPTGSCEVINIRKSNRVAYRYTLVTSLKTYIIECSKECKVRTDKGVKKIDELTPGIGLYVHGAYIPQRLTMIKKVTRQQLEETKMYSLETTDNYYVEEVIFAK